MTWTRSPARKRRPVRWQDLANPLDAHDDAERRHLYRGGRGRERGAQTAAGDDGQPVVSDHDTAKGVLRIPNAALRFFPREAGEVRPGDRQLVEDKPSEGEESAEAPRAPLRPPRIAGARTSRKKRYVWIADGEALAAVEVETGLSDDVATELVVRQSQRRPVAGHRRERRKRRPG